MLAKNIFSLVILILFFSSCHNRVGYTAADKVYFIVRHAEKLAGNDPMLSTEGNERAGDLYRRLKNEKVEKIYTTKFNRTIHTADSLRIYQNIDTAYYAGDTEGKGFLRALEKRAEPANRILVIGHSNTLGGIIRAIGAEYTITTVDENKYDALFIVKIKNGKAVLVEEKYGK